MIVLGGVALSTLGSGGGKGGDRADRPLSPLERRAQRISARMERSTGDPSLLRRTMHAWIAAGDDRLNKLDLSRQAIPDAVTEDIRTGLRAWERYLRATGGEVGGDIAEQAGGAYFSLLEIGSRNLGELEADAAGAARALQIAGRRKPILFTLSNTAIYSYFNGEFAVGDRAAEGAAADVDPKAAVAVRNQLVGYRKRGEAFRRQLKRAAASLAGSGKDELEEPLRAYASSTGINRDGPSG